MITARNVGDIISEINMTLAADPNSIFWLLEGVTDVKFFKPRLTGGISVIDATGKYKIIATIAKISESASLKNLPVLGVVDNDYDWLVGCAMPENIVSTEPRDLEGILLRANCINNVLAEFGNSRKVEAFERREGPIIEAVLSRSLVFGKIRAVNSLGARVCMKAFKPIQFFNKDWSYDEEMMYSKAIQLGVAGSVEELREKVLELPEANPWYYVRGHDAIDVLCGGIIAVLGGAKVSASLIEPVLRQSLTVEQFGNTDIHKQSTQWHERRNLPYPYLNSN